MPLVSMKPVLDKALAGGYAVGAFNVVNLEFLEAILETAESKKSPVVLNIAEVHFPFVNLENICPAIVAMAGRSAVPVVLNLDHGMSPATVIRAIRNGFTSVMFDGSKLDEAENVRISREVVGFCKPLGISVEAEFGAVGGNESGGIEAEANPDLFTDPDRTAGFVKSTGIDALAVAVGNVHGKYRGEPKLDFGRLERIRDKTGIPLVLHGGSGIPDADFRKAISLGIAKINFYTGMSQAALAVVLEKAGSLGRTYHDFPLLMSQIKKRVAGTVAEQIDVFGSAGKA